MMPEVEIIQSCPQRPHVAVELSSASFAWEISGHSAQPTPRGTPSVGLVQRRGHKKSPEKLEAGKQSEDPGRQLLAEGEPAGPEGEAAPIPTVSQRLQRTLHCIDLSVPKVRALNYLPASFWKHHSL